MLYISESSDSLFWLCPQSLEQYSCPRCTLLNPVSNQVCSICQTPRPTATGAMSGAISSDALERSTNASAQVRLAVASSSMKCCVTVVVVASRADWSRLVRVFWGFTHRYHITNPSLLPCLPRSQCRGPVVWWSSWWGCPAPAKAFSRTASSAWLGWSGGRERGRLCARSNQMPTVACIGVPAHSWH